MSDVVTDELVEASRKVLDAELPPPAGFESGPLAERWAEVQCSLGDLGWFDLLVPSATGGLGLSPDVACRLVRLAGSYLVPGPVVEAVLTMPWLSTQTGVGEHLGAVATVDPGHDLARRCGRRSPITLHRGRLQGSVAAVLGAGTADVLLVHVLDDDAERVVILPSAHPGVCVEVRRGADPCQPVGQVAFDCAVGEEHLLGEADDGLPARLRACSRLGCAAYLAGISERVLAFGVDHALERKQFGRPIGAFQAVQHLLASVAVIASTLANLTDAAAGELAAADDHEAVLIGATAKARASVDAVLACETVLQVLGGLGFTIDHPLHHYLKRAISLAAHHGSPAELHLLAGRLVLERTQDQRNR